MTVERRDVTFKTGDSFAAGWFFLPEHIAPGAHVPAVALAPGTGGVKELNHEPFARRFAEQRVAALLFEYRGFGASGGEPRQRILPRDQIEDYRSALTWLSLQPEIDDDRLGVWGASMSGAHVIHVGAYDPRVRAVVSMVGPMDLHAMIRAAVGEERFAAMQQLTVQERVRRVTEGGEPYFPNVAPPDHDGFAFQTDQGSNEYFPVATPEIAPSWRNEIAMSSLEAILEYPPGKSIELIAPRPLLMISANEDVNASAEQIRAAFARAGEPKRLLEVAGDHYSVYPWTNGQNADEVIQTAADWFAEHLSVSSPPAAAPRLAHA
jgi:fermentation-respiration switch protein FrsA (DUF1100 family)